MRDVLIYRGILIIIGVFALCKSIYHFNRYYKNIKNEKEKRKVI